MRYMAIHRGSDFNQPPSEEMIEAMGALIGDMAASGALVSTGGLQGPDTGFTVRLDDDDEVVVSDGPFTEAKEVVGGYAIYDVDSKDEAIEWTKRFLRVVGEGYTEIRAMHQPEPGEPDIVKGEFEARTS